MHGNHTMMIIGVIILIKGLILRELDVFNSGILTLIFLVGLGFVVFAVYRLAEEERKKQ